MKPIFCSQTVLIPDDMITEYERTMFEIFDTGHRTWGHYISVHYGHLARMGEGLFKRIFN